MIHIADNENNKVNQKFINKQIPQTVDAPGSFLLVNGDQVQRSLSPQVISPDGVAGEVSQYPNPLGSQSQIHYQRQNQRHYQKLTDAMVNNLDLKELTVYDIMAGNVFTTKDVVLPNKNNLIFESDEIRFMMVMNISNENEIELGYDNSWTSCCYDTIIKPGHAGMFFLREKGDIYRCL